MKKFFSFLFMMLMAVSSLTLVGCSSDDDDAGGNYSEMIVGSWTNRITWDDEEGWYSEDYIQFHSDGTFVEIDIDNLSGNLEGEVSEGTWSVSGKNLTMRTDDVKDGLDTFTSPISKMTESKFVVNAAGIEMEYTKVSDSVFEKYYNEYK